VTASSQQPRSIIRPPALVPFSLCLITLASLP
jgi:hypothetical protein